MDTKIDKRTMERIGELKYPIPNSFDPNVFCSECGLEFNQPVREARQGGYSELVTYCQGCGATYISK
jgi:hypothetical protein